MSNYYDKVYDSEAYSIEQAILAEDVSFSNIKDIQGKFFLKILTPMVESEKASIKNSKGIKSANYITLTIPSYLLFGFMNITMSTIEVPTKMDPDTGVPTNFEKYNVLVPGGKSKGFTIPKGTIFFVEFLGGQADADKAYIIGISPVKYVN